MPRRKAARALRALCLENVAANMQQLWAKDYVERSLDEQRFRYLMGPFSELGEAPGGARAGSGGGAALAGPGWEGGCLPRATGRREVGRPLKPLRAGGGEAGGRRPPRPRGEGRPLSPAPPGLNFPSPPSPFSFSSPPPLRPPPFLPLPLPHSSRLPGPGADRLPGQQAARDAAGAALAAGAAADGAGPGPVLPAGDPGRGADDLQPLQGGRRGCWGGGGRLRFLRSSSLAPRGPALPAGCPLRLTPVSVFVWLGGRCLLSSSGSSWSE